MNRTSSSIILALVILLSGCAQKREVIVRESGRADTLRITVAKRDSIFIHDSTATDTSRDGDTIRIRETRWRTKYIERTRTDTVYQSARDTVTLVHESVTEVEKEKPMNWMHRGLMAVGAVALCIVALLVIRKLPGSPA
jgi:hypothetical protein